MQVISCNGIKVNNCLIDGIQKGIYVQNGPCHITQTVFSNFIVGIDYVKPGYAPTSTNKCYRAVDYRLEDCTFTGAATLPYKFPSDYKIGTPTGPVQVLPPPPLSSFAGVYFEHMPGTTDTAAPQMLALRCTFDNVQLGHIHPGI